MHNNMVWVDIPVLDLDRAIAFYAAVLGRPVSKQGGPGFSFGLFTHEGEEVGGCLVQTPDNSPAAHGPLIYLNAHGRIDAALQAALAQGGRVLDEVHQIGPNGFRAVLLDSEGNRIALHSMTR